MIDSYSSRSHSPRPRPTVKPSGPDFSAGRPGRDLGRPSGPGPPPDRRLTVGHRRRTARYRRQTADYRPTGRRFRCRVASVRQPREPIRRPQAPSGAGVVTIGRTGAGSRFATAQPAEPPIRFCTSRVRRPLATRQLAGYFQCGNGGSGRFGVCWPPAAFRSAVVTEGPHRECGGAESNRRLPTLTVATRETPGVCPREHCADAPTPTPPPL